MSFYTPLNIQKFETGLVQSRPNFLIPDDAFPVLENAFIWRETIRRKSGYKLLGRLRRVLTAQALGNLDGAGAFSGNIRTILIAALAMDAKEVYSDIEPGTLTLSDGTNTYTDNGLGVLTGAPAGSGKINYSTMALTITGGALVGALTADLNYYPRLPVMGLRSEELNNINSERLIAFDQVYAYSFNAGFQEFISGTTWTGTNSDFFWSTNYWVGAGNLKIFWVTNFSGKTGDPIRYTNGTTWIDFAPTIDSAGNKLQQCLAMVPYRGRMLTVNTFEGMTLATSNQYRQRIRWAAIGNPFSDVSAVVADVNADAWRDDIPGQGGFLDIPTAEDITAIGFVRDNLVIFTERSTWQLRYNGRSIAPFQIEKVNTELGAESTFSAIQFDTSLVAIGDKGIVECDSYKSDRIDIKIPDLTYRFNNDNAGTKRVHGIRDFQQRIAYWTYVDTRENQNQQNVYPDRRLVYNYENDSWGIFRDSFTTLGTFQSQESARWRDFPGPDPANQWQNQNYPWINRPALFPSIVGGNQQGYIEFLGQYNFDATASNDFSLSIRNITGNVTTPTSINSPDHNLLTGDVVQIDNIPTATDFSDLNGGIYGIIRVDSDNFLISSYNTITGKFDSGNIHAAGTYIGGGEIIIRDNFRIVSKKFNFLEDGQTIQLGYLDILLNSTTSGAITMNIYTNYSDDDAVNVKPQNNVGDVSDSFFNSVIPTAPEVDKNSSKYWQRVYCSTRGSFITIEYTFSNAQMAGEEQQQDVEISSQILYLRKSGKQLTAF